MSEPTPSYSPSSVADAFAPDIGHDTLGEVHVFLGIFQGIVSEIEAYRSGADAEAAFARFCGVSYSDFAEGRAELNYKYEDSTVYVVPVM